MHRAPAARNTAFSVLQGGFSAFSECWTSWELRDINLAQLRQKTASHVIRPRPQATSTHYKGVMHVMCSEEELFEFFSTAEPPTGLNQVLKDVEKFVDRHKKDGRRVVLVTVSSEQVRAYVRTCAIMSRLFAHAHFERKCDTGTVHTAYR